MKRSLVVLLAVLVAPINTLGQTPLTGRWANDKTVTASNSAPTMPRANPFDPSGKSVLVSDTTKEWARPHLVQLNLILAGIRVTGSITESGRTGALQVEEGTLTGKTFTFKTNRLTPQGMETVLWKGEIVDFTTIIVVPTLLRPTQTNSKELGRGFAAGPGLPGAGQDAPPHDVKAIGGALVLRRTD